MQSSNSPPRYGAGGPPGGPPQRPPPPPPSQRPPPPPPGGPPPGGPEAWNRQRFAGGSSSAGSGIFSNVGSAMQDALERIRERQQQNRQMAQSGKMPQQQSGAAGLGQLVRGAYDRARSEPQGQNMQPAVEPGGQDMQIGGGGFAELNPGGGAAWGQPPGAQQGRAEPQMPQTGMAGLGQAGSRFMQMARARALRDSGSGG